MAFFDDLTKALTEAVDTTVKGAEKLGGQAKLKYQIMTQKKELEKLYASIGKMNYEAFKAGTDNSENLTEAYAKVENLLAAIAALEADAAKAANCKICPECGEKLSKETIFCHKCGTQQEIDE